MLAALAILAVLFYFVGVGYDGWGCGGSVLCHPCVNQNYLKTTGALLFTAACITMFLATVLILVVIFDEEWMLLVAGLTAILAAIMGIAGVFYYHDYVDVWSPMLSGIAMMFTVVLTACIGFDICASATE